MEDLSVSEVRGGGSAGKESACNVGDPGSIPGSGRSPGEGKSYSLQYSGLENSMDYTESDTTERLSLSLSSILAWRIPCTEDPDRLESVRLQRSQPQLND